MRLAFHLDLTSMLLGLSIFIGFNLHAPLAQAIPPKTETLCQNALHTLTLEDNKVAIYHERMLKPFLSFEKLLQTGKSPRSIATQLINGNYRFEFFKEKALLNFYQDARWSKEINAFQDPVKRLEDKIGKCVDYQTWVAQANEIGLPEKAVLTLKNEFSTQKKELEALLISDSWYAQGAPSPRLSAFLDALNNMKVPTQKEDANYTYKTLKRQLKELDEGDLDMQDLSQGMHKLRRKIRSLPILFMALLGRVHIVDDHLQVPENLKPFQFLDASQKKYLTFEETRFELKNQIKVNRSSVVAFNYFIYQLGLLKDEAEMREAFNHALVSAGLYDSAKKADRWLLPFLKRKIKWQEFNPRSEILYEQLFESKLLDDFIQ